VATSRPFPVYETILCVLIQLHDAVISVMRLYAGSARKHWPDLAATVETVAQTGALAIQNASK